MYDRIRRHRGVLTIAVAIFFGGTGWALASIPGTDGTISACYATRGGEVRIIDSTASCMARETAIRWNEEGPAGPAGRAGAEGPQGATGPQGPPGPGVTVLDGAAADTVGFTHEGEDPVDLGGPELTIDVPVEGALVEFMGSLELSGRCPVFAIVHETPIEEAQSPTFFVPAFPPAGEGFQAWYSSASGESTLRGSWIVRPLAGGSHTFRMRYYIQGTESCSGSIRNRHIYAVVLG